jgi:hypothetical protein
MPHYFDWHHINRFKPWTFLDMSTKKSGIYLTPIQFFPYHAHMERHLKKQIIDDLNEKMEYDHITQNQTHLPTRFLKNQKWECFQFYFRQ